MQCSQFVFGCVYVRHTLIAWARFLWSCPQTTSLVVLVRPGGYRGVQKIVMACKSRNGAGATWYWTTGLTRRRLTCLKDHARA